VLNRAQYISIMTLIYLRRHLTKYVKCMAKLETTRHTTSFAIRTQWVCPWLPASSISGRELYNLSGSFLSIQSLIVFFEELVQINLSVWSDSNSNLVCTFDDLVFSSLTNLLMLPWYGVSRTCCMMSS